MFLVAVVSTGGNSFLFSFNLIFSVLYDGCGIDNLDTDDVFAGMSIKDDDDDDDVVEEHLLFGGDTTSSSFSVVGLELIFFSSSSK